MIRMIATLLCLGLAIIFAYFYYVAYFRWRNCFNEAGRCFDSDAGVVHLQQSGIVWLLLAVLALVAGIFNAWHLIRNKR